MKILIVSSDRTAAHGAACNLGDALLTDAVVHALRQRGHDPVAADFGEAQRSTSDGPRLRISGVGALAEAIRQVDGVLIGGGTLLQDDTPHLLIGGLPRLVAATVAVARVTRRPAVFYGVGMDSIERRAPRMLVRYAGRRAPAWVRETASQERFQEVVGRPAHLGADAALLHNLETAPKTNRAGITLALNRADARALEVREVETLNRLGSANSSFLSMDQQPDIADRLFLPTVVAASFDHDSPAPTGWAEAVQRIQESELVIASRMHALYIAALVGVPAIAIGRLEKVRSFSDEFGISHYATIAEALDGKGNWNLRSVSISTAKLRAEQALDQAIDSLASRAG